MHEQLVEIERQLWTNDPAFYEQAYLPEAVLIFPGVGKIDRATAVDAIRDENRQGRHWAEVAFDDVAILTLDNATELLTYSASARWNYEPSASRTICATIYVKRQGKWRVAFHQQTAD